MMICCKLRLVWRGNKKVSRLVANIKLIKNAIHESDQIQEVASQRTNIDIPGQVYGNPNDLMQ
jgi:hypothetical protein